MYRYVCNGVGGEDRAVLMCISIHVMVVVLLVVVGVGAGLSVKGMYSIHQLASGDGAE